MGRVTSRSLVNMRSTAITLVLGLSFSVINTASGQQQFGGPFGGQGGGQGGGGFGGGGGGGLFPGGIAINPDGVISSPEARRINPKLEQKRLKAVAAQYLSDDMAKSSELRKVSLSRLEAHCQEAIERGQPIPLSCRYLAGITQIQYLFAAPESGDIIIAGPAEGFAGMADGRVVGTDSGRPVLTLDDLLVMLRLDSTQKQLGCSFDPEPERLARCQEWNRTNSSPASLAVAGQRFGQIAQILGNWNVTVFGFPGSSHAAVTTVEADYRLKRISLGLDRPAIRGFRSHLDMSGANENTFRRWWFAPRYEVIERSSDGNAFHLDGPRLQLMSQQEFVDSQGNRSASPFKQISVEKYTVQFNKHIDELCQQVPSFAAVQNLFDLAVVAALMRSEQLPQKVGWVPRLFLDNAALPLLRFEVPEEVPSLVNVKSLNRRLLVGLIGGGVVIVPDRVIDQTDVLPADAIPAYAAAEQDAPWWWD